MGSSPIFGGVCVAPYLVFSVVLCFVCLRPLSCVPNVASVSGLSSHDYHCFSLAFTCLFLHAICYFLHFSFDLVEGYCPYQVAGL